MTEEWRKIEGYEPYEISNEGRLRRNGIVLSTPVGPMGSGYKRKYLKDLKKNVLIHRLVASAFIPNPYCYPVINHKDGNTLNNHVVNLEWCTYKHNMQHAVDNGLKPILKGEKCGRSKLKNIDVSVIKTALCSGFKVNDIANYFKVDQSTVSLIKSGKNWKHISTPC